MDPTAAPAEDLSTLYAQRWEVETIFDELKTHQRGPKVVLRSKTPDGVRQEAYGYLCLHYAVRALMHTAAGDAGLDPDRVSFTRSLRAARRGARTQSGIAPRQLAVALTTAITDKEWLTGAGGHVGMALKRRLADRPNEVPPLGRHDDLAAALEPAARRTDWRPGP